jgi:hypothetical protein
VRVRVTALTVTTLRTSTFPPFCMLANIRLTLVAVSSKHFNYISKTFVFFASPTQTTTFTINFQKQFLSWRIN